MKVNTKKKVIILVGICLAVLIGAFIGDRILSKKYFVKIEYKEIVQKIENKESFVLVISQTQCNHCASYKPKIAKLAKKHEMFIYYIDADLLSGDEKIEFESNFKYDGTPTTIKYPTFQGVTYAMNYINMNDAYNISKALVNGNEVYGLNKNTTDSHLIKNSEWGAVAYLSESKYGLNGTNIYINNATLNNSESSVYAVTGCCAKGDNPDAGAVATTISAINERSMMQILLPLIATKSLYISPPIRSHPSFSPQYR